MSSKLTSLLLPLSPLSPSNQSCWVCLEDEADVDSVGKAWAHPCHCSLVAHEKCLLVWIASQEQAQLKPGPISCPQCKEPYTIYEESSLPLEIFNMGDEIIGRGCAALILTGIASSFIFTSGVLGYSSLRCYLGKRATTLVLGNSVRSWPIWALVAVPLLPYAQITSAFSSDILSVERFTFLESGLILLPIFFLPRAPANPLVPAWSLSNPRLFSLAWTFPPGPGLTLALLPALNVVYLNLKRRVQRSVLLGTGLFAPWSNSSSSDGGRRGGQFNLGGDDQIFGVRLNIEIEDAHPNNPPPAVELAPPPAPPALADEALYLTRHSLTRLACGALLSPALSALAGWGLEKAARKWSPGLGRFLGLKGLPPVYGKQGGGGWWMGTAGAGGWGGGARGREEGELDPVWWRNAVGGCALVLVKE
ncbi:hypothetical protein BDY24DRAFT_395685 [Mrakia frigida]|uniref:uncharacterized protein n=1 Tax=Mrakia frigida TaxID=29902 RepID=UPI003FCC14B0